MSVYETENSGDWKMNTNIWVSAAAAVATLLLFAGTPASAHEDHDGQAKEAAATPLATAGDRPEPSARQPAHGDHSDRSPVPAHDSEPALAKPESNVPKPLAWLGKFHPPVTHFPIALLSAAALAELLFMRTGKDRFEHAVHFTVWFGALAAIAAATLGWFFAGFQLFDEERLMTLHRWAGTSTALFACGLLYTMERAKRSSFRAVLFSSAGLVGATGFLGGALLYGLDHYAW
jgi:uncharacterized membrane protein